MNILMMTNSYIPYTGGVERSVSTFTQQLRAMGNRVMVVAPDTEEPLPAEQDIIRVSSIKNFNQSNLPVLVPIPGILNRHLEVFRPDIVHSHFPFLVGSTAVRVAAKLEVPLVFTYHTMYEKYIHYVSMDSDAVRRFVIELTRGYANLCDLVVAPSESIRQVLEEREVSAPIVVIPTGVDPDQFAEGDGRAFREKYRLPRDAFVIGHVGRLAPEKNLRFLAEAVAKFLAAHLEACFLAAGEGTERETMEEVFRTARRHRQVYFVGKQLGRDLVDCYHAMDIFVFSSLTETQGMVLLEAMAAGRPVIALDGSGVRDVVRDGQNGRLLDRPDTDAFAGAIEEAARRSPEERRRLKEQALETARRFSIANCTRRLLESYQAIPAVQSASGHERISRGEQLMNELKAEWELLKNVAVALGHSFSSEGG
jgi:1,2-diacylglycerol 3-alpha-glucosyltransferase